MQTTSASLIYIGNFADIDTDETNHMIENPSSLYQTFSSADMSVVNVDQTDANSDGRLQTDSNGQTGDTFTYDVGGGSVTSNLDGIGRFFVDYVDENGGSQSTVVSVYQTDNGDVFLRFPNGLQISSATITGMHSDGFSDISFGSASSSATVVCFSSGTLIETQWGYRTVEDLQVGDTVKTLDHGLQPIRWIRRSEHCIEVSDTQDKPILISAGALGNGRPAHDLIVSPQHRILVGGNQQLTGCFKGEAFVPAKALTGLHGVRQMHGKKAMTWVHFSCDRHEVVSANGCLTESLLLGRMVVNGLSPLSRQVLTDMYGLPGDPNEALNGPAARECLKVGNVRRQIKTTTMSSSCPVKRTVGCYQADLNKSHYHSESSN